MDDVFSIWPTLAEMARDLGAPYPTVQSWHRRGGIPIRRFPDVVAAARKRGSDLTMEGLVALYIASKDAA